MAGLSRGRRAAFYAILFGVAYAMIEVLALAAHFAVHRKAFSFAEHTTERRAILTAAETSLNREIGAIPVGSPPGSIYEVLHPYLGYVQDPTRTAGYSELGFPDAEVRIYPKDPNRVVVGIFGGSFAEGLARTTKDVITERLRASPRFAGKEIRVLCLALGGYKQPQQLINMAYLASLGMRLDVVVTLDGLNEVALGAGDNYSRGVFPAYPRNWPVRVGARDDVLRALEREHAELVDRRRTLARIASSAPLRYSIAVNVAWKAADILVADRAVEVNVKALRHRPPPESMSYMARGPASRYPDEGALYEDLAAIWKSASLQMHALATANGGKYLHFLQPNQYVSGSKTMGAEERAMAWDDKHPYRHSVEVGYPRLREKGRELAAQGVHFVDLTMALADRPEPLYGDTCCHLTVAGYRILAARIADEIAGRP